MKVYITSYILKDKGARKEGITPMYCLCYAVYIVNALTRARWFSDSAAAINFIQLYHLVSPRVLTDYWRSLIKIHTVKNISVFLREFSWQSGTSGVPVFFTA